MIPNLLLSLQPLPRFNPDHLPNRGFCHVLYGTYPQPKTKLGQKKADENNKKQIID